MTSSRSSARTLHAHCYRMLGSLHDADDALQDTLLRAWRGLPGFRGRSSLRTWLYRIATNVCLDAIARRPKRVLPIDYESEEREATLWIEPYPDAGRSRTATPPPRRATSGARRSSWRSWRRSSTFPRGSGRR